MCLGKTLDKSASQDSQLLGTNLGRMLSQHAYQLSYDHVVVTEVLGMNVWNHFLVHWVTHFTTLFIFCILSYVHQRYPIDVLLIYYVDKPVILILQPVLILLDFSDDEGIAESGMWQGSASVSDHSIEDIGFFDNQETKYSSMYECVVFQKGRPTGWWRGKMNNHLFIGAFLKIWIYYMTINF